MDKQGTQAVQDLQQARDQMLASLNLLQQKMSDLITVGERTETPLSEMEAFAARVADDLAAPLCGLVDYLRRLQERYKSRSDALEFVGNLLVGVVGMQELVTDLTTFARPFDKSPTTIYCEVALLRAQEALQSKIVESNAKVGHDPLPTVTADLAQMTQLLGHLIGNGIKFCDHPPPEVNLSARREGGMWCFSVRDHGIGIAPDDHGRLFKPFRRLPIAAAWPGVGLGLAVCKKIVEGHGGRIWVESEVGQGSTFQFTLPA
jgi:chemotaxis family two-component system sensor kinase Cph1